MRHTTARAHRPLSGYVGGDLEEIGLWIVDKLPAVVSEHAQEHLLGEIVDIGARAREKRRQRHPPLAKPVAKLAWRTASSRQRHPPVRTHLRSSCYDWAN